MCQLNSVLFLTWSYSLLSHFFFLFVFLSLFRQRAMGGQGKWKLKAARPQQLFLFPQ